MLGRTHVSLGLMATLLLIPVIGVSLGDKGFNTTAFIVAIIGALLPDLDMGSSSLGGKFGFIKAKHIKKLWIFVLVVASLISIVFLKDTSLFYGIALLIFLGFIFADKFASKSYFALRNLIQSIVGLSIIIFSYYYKQPSLSFIGVTLIILLLSKHRGFSHSLIFLGGLTYAVRKISLEYIGVDYSLVFAISMGAHILADMLTKLGVGLFLPFSNKRIKFPYTIRTGGRAEKIIFAASIIYVFNILRNL